MDCRLKTYIYVKFPKYDHYTDYVIKMEGRAKI